MPSKLSQVFVTFSSYKNDFSFFIQDKFTNCTLKQTTPCPLNYVHSWRSAGSSQPHKLVMEEVTWDSAACKLPLKFTNFSQATPQMRECFYLLTLSDIQSNPMAAPVSKVNLLASCFDHPHSPNEIDGSLHHFCDNTSSADGPISIDRAPAGVFVLSRLALCNDHGMEIAMPNAGAALNQNICHNTTFCAFTIMFNAAAAQVTPVDPMSHDSLMSARKHAVLSQDLQQLFLNLIL